MPHTESESAAAIHAALTGLMAQWSAPSLQSAVATDAGLEIDSFDIAPLYSLGTHGPLRASALADALQISRPTMTKQLDRLEARGLVQREPDGGDRRARIVHLTPAGNTAHARLVERGQRMLNEALRTWDSAEASAFAAQLQRFVADLGASPSAAPDAQKRLPAHKQGSNSDPIRIAEWRNP